MILYQIQSEKKIWLKHKKIIIKWADFGLNQFSSKKIDRLIIYYVFYSSSLELSNDIQLDKLQKIFTILLPIISHLLILMSFPLNKSHFKQVIKTLKKNQQNKQQSPSILHYYPEFLLLLQAKQIDYNKRNKALDKYILEQFLKTNDSDEEMNICKKFLKKYYKKRDCIVIKENCEDQDCQLQFIRFKILKTRVKPLQYFNFNGDEVIQYLNKTFEEQSLNLEKISDNISKKQVKFKKAFINTSQQTIYNTWSQQIDSFFQQKIFPKIKSQQSIQLINKFTTFLNNELKKKLKQQKQKSLDERTQIIQNEQKRLKKLFNMDVLNEMCIACGFKQQQIKYYIEQLSQKAQNEYVQVGEINLEVMDSQNSNIPLQSNINPRQVQKNQKFKKPPNKQEETQL